MSRATDRNVRGYFIAPFAFLGESGKMLFMPKKTEKTEKSKVSKAPTKAEKPSEFAVIVTGGKQYKVSVGETLSIEKIKGEFKEGDKLIFDKVLLVDDGSNATIGTPYIDGATVVAELKEIGRAAKVNVVKYKQKSRYFKKRGHRQPFFKVKITALK
jgi:large subunit ribosomal protein L21